MLSVCRWFSLIGFVLIVVPHNVRAAEVTQLYSVSVPVVDRSESARKAAELDSMKAVLVKVSGSANVVTLAGIIENLPKAAAYIQRYQYQQLPRPINFNGVETQLKFEASFDGRAIERLLQASSASVWGMRRPLVLIWMVINDESGRRIIGSDDDADLAREWNDAANVRGVPSMLPLYDLEEADAVQVADVYGRFIEPLQAVSKKYGPEAMLVGRLEKNGNVWNGQWTLAHGNLRKNISAEASNRADVLQSVMAQVAETFAQKYAVVVDPSKESEVLVKISEIHSTQDYGAVQSLLQSLQVVRQADARDVNHHTIIFAVRLIADISMLQQALTTDSRLQLVGDGLNNSLEYEWRP